MFIRDRHPQEVLATVAEVYRSDADRLFELCAGRTTVMATGDHPFMCNGQWVPASGICMGDRLQTRHAAMARLSRRHIRHLHDPVKVFNLNVQRTHSYYVGEGGLLVHNMCIRKQEIEEKITVLRAKWHALNEKRVSVLEEAAKEQDMPFFRRPMQQIRDNQLRGLDDQIRQIAYSIREMNKAISQMKP